MLNPKFPFASKSGCGLFHVVTTGKLFVILQINMKKYQQPSTTQ